MKRLEHKKNLFLRKVGWVYARRRDEARFYFYLNVKDMLKDGGEGK